MKAQLNFSAVAVVLVLMAGTLNNAKAAVCTANVNVATSCSDLQLTNAGDITISAPATITDTGTGNSVTNNPGTTTSLTNLGTISNTGAIGFGIYNFGTLTTLNNSGTIRSTQWNGIWNSVGSGITRIGTLNNSGTIEGYFNAVNNHATIDTLTNAASGFITGTNGNGIYNDGLITTVTNSGAITGTGGYGVENISGTITTLTNYGTITGTTRGIHNGGIITTLNNGQGLAGALTYTGVLPVNYNIIVNSPTSFGKLSATTVTGSMTFGIYDSTLRKGTYSAVLTGIASSGAGSVLASSITGIYNGFTYTLINSAGTTWDLSISGASTADTHSSLAASAYVLRGVYNLQTATINNGLNYDCTVFDTHGVCISVGGRYTSTDSPGTNNGNALVVASYNLTDHVRVGGYLDQNISNSTPTGIKLNNGSPLAGLFGVWNEHKSGEGLEVRVAAGYGDKDLTVTRSVIGTSEAGVGKSQLTSQAVSTTVSYGTALASNWMVSPYAGVRYTRIKAGRYTEGSSADVTAPLTYDALVQQSTTALAGVRFSGRASPKTLLTMSAGVEQDTNNVGNSYNASGVTGLTPITFNPNIQKTRAVANAGVYYDITNTQRIGLNAMYRQEAFQSTNTVTALVTYQVGL